MNTRLSSKYTTQTMNFGIASAIHLFIKNRLSKRKPDDSNRKFKREQFKNFLYRESMIRIIDHSNLLTSTAASISINRD
ncbi:MAG: hypothetical protein LBB88_06915 [Planctomycetaceae bacterium]|nr:hypothetical protein [Planctomycetaceae bacterium]